MPEAARQAQIYCSALENPMSRLTEIPIRVEPLANTATRGKRRLGRRRRRDSERAGQLLERLADGQSPASIDLRSLPMSPQDRAELQQVLGEGEVQATCNAQGLSKMRETAFRAFGGWSTLILRAN
jgi:hypothetical protein